MRLLPLLISSALFFTIIHATNSTTTSNQHLCQTKEGTQTLAKMFLPQYPAQGGRALSLMSMLMVKVYCHSIGIKVDFHDIVSLEQTSNVTASAGTSSASIETTIQTTIETTSTAEAIIETTSTIETTIETTYTIETTSSIETTSTVVPTSTIETTSTTTSTMETASTTTSLESLMATTTTATTTSTPVPIMASSSSNARFAPYLDMGLSNRPKLSETNLSSISLAFILSDKLQRGKPAIGTGSIRLDSLDQEITDFQTIGGKVILSFGGQVGDMVACAHSASGNGSSSAGEEELLATYEALVQKYKPIALDFDLEGDNLLNVPCNQLRNRVLGKLQQKTGIEIYFTLPVGRDGLSPASLTVIQDAQSSGVKLSLINLMTMDFGADAIKAASPLSNCQTAVQAAQTQLSQKIPVGITPMIGRDDQNAVMTPSDLETLVKWARSLPTPVSHFAFWSLTRDAPGKESEPRYLNSGLESVKAGDFSRAVLAALN